MNFTRARAAPKFSGLEASAFVERGFRLVTIGGDLEIVREGVAAAASALGDDMK